jgi:hypothetical protein
MLVDFNIRNEKVRPIKRKELNINSIQFGLSMTSLINIHSNSPFASKRIYIQVCSSKMLSNVKVNDEYFISKYNEKYNIG